jgi:hypothetical protein
MKITKKRTVAQHEGKHCWAARGTSQVHATSHETLFFSPGNFAGPRYQSRNLILFFVIMKITKKITVAQHEGKHCTAPWLWLSGSPAGSGLPGSLASLAPLPGSCHAAWLPGFPGSPWLRLRGCVVRLPGSFLVHWDLSSRALPAPVPGECRRALAPWLLGSPRSWAPWLPGFLGSWPLSPGPWLLRPPGSLAP